MAPGTLYLHGSQVRYTTYGHFQATVGSSAVGLPGLPGDWSQRIFRVVIRVLAGDVNFRDDGTNPSDTTGFPIKQDETLVYDGSDLSAVKLIRAASAAADADVRVWYMGL